MLVAVEEQCWHHAYGQLIFNHKHFPRHSHTQYSLYFTTRYVDKRVLLLHHFGSSQIQAFTCLKTEAANVFLGLAVDPHNHSLMHHNNVTLYTHDQPLQNNFCVASTKHAHASYNESVHLAEHMKPCEPCANSVRGPATQTSLYLRE